MGFIKNDIPGFDDIIFAERNKEYGAYQLRKKYNAVVIAGLVFAVIICSLAVVIPFLTRNNEVYIVSGGSRNVVAHMDNLELPKEIYIPPVAPPKKPKNIPDLVAYVPPVVVDTVLPIDKKTLSNDEMLANDPSDQETKTTGGYGDELLDGEVGSGESGSFYLVEVMPSFKGGGLDKFREWITRHTNYPQEAVDKRIKGTVFLSFIVERDGSISTVTIMKGVNPILDNEAVKVISESPKWSPGLQRGQPVRVRYLIPVNFNYL